MYNAIISEKERQQNKLEINSIRKLCKLCSNGSNGKLYDKQICRRIPRQKILCRVSKCRCCRKYSKKKRLKKIFGAEHVNVQPHSGAQSKYGSI